MALFRYITALRLVLWRWDCSHEDNISRVVFYGNGTAHPPMAARGINGALILPTLAERCMSLCMRKAISNYSRSMFFYQIAEARLRDKFACGKPVLELNKVLREENYTRESSALE